MDIDEIEDEGLKRKALGGKKDSQAKKAKSQSPATPSNQNDASSSSNQNPSSSSTPSLLTMSIDRTVELKLNTIQQLAMWLLGAHRTAPPGILVTNKEKLQKVVVLFVGGIDAQVYATHSSSLKSLHPFNEVYPVKLPGNKGFLYNPIQAFLHAPVSKDLQQKLQADFAASWRPKLKPDGTVCPSTYLLTPAALEEHKYPSKKDNPDYFELTLVNDSEKDGDVMFCIDCEMCETDFGKELTRITVIDSKLALVYDSLVVPDNPIRNYHTQYSGITAEMLSMENTKLADVQAHLQKLIPRNAILVGHSLENDCHALKLIHTRVIDTAVIFGSSRGLMYKPSLRSLAHELLNIKIQEGSGGHNSIEDATTCMRLVQEKFKRGPKFGAPSITEESVFAKVDRTGKQSCYIDLAQPVKKHAAHGVHLIPCASDKEVVEAFGSSAARSSQFVFLRLSGVLLDEAPQKAGSSGPDGSEDVESASKETPPPLPFEERLRILDGHIDRIMAQLPSSSVFMVLTESNPSEVHALYKQKMQSKMAADLWSDDLEKKFEDTINLARNGLLFASCLN